MKRLKIIAVAIITILLVALGTYNGVEAIYNSSEKGYQSKYQLGIGKGFEFTWDLWRKDNLYCVEYDQKMSDGVYYGFTWSNPVTIEGDKATFGDGRVVISPYNNILAAIVCPTDLGRRSRFAGSTYTWSYRMGDNGVPTNSFGNGRKSDAQEGLYYYWNVWYDSMKDANGNNVAYENGFRRDPNGWKGDGNDTHKYCGQWGYNRLKELNLLEKYDFKVVIYYLRNNSGSAYQNFIAVYPEPPSEKSDEIKVQKVWHDNNNAYNTRPSSIIVELLANGESTGKTLTLNASNNWSGKFEDLEDFDTTTYTIREVSCTGYKVAITGSAKSGFTITNRLLTEVTVKKEWNDQDNFDEIRPKEIKVTLYSNGTSTGKTATLSAANNWQATFKGLYMCDSSGKVITYSVEEEQIDGYESTSKSSIDSSNGNTTITVTNTHTPNYAGYIEITGKVWEDIRDGKATAYNGVIDEDEKGLGGIKVTLKDKDGKQFDATSTTTTAEDGTYTIKVNYDNSKNVYKLYQDSATVEKKLFEQNAYVEFEYDGFKYTTVKVVASSATGYQQVNQSKAKEDTTSRKALDDKFAEVNSSSTMISEADKKVIATTKNVITTSFKTYKNQAVNLATRTESKAIKYCNGNGTYIQTDPNGAWNAIIEGQHTCENCTGAGHNLKTFNGIGVTTIKNVNLGLYKREQPDLSIKDGIHKVEIVDQYEGETYEYEANAFNPDNLEETTDEIKVQFANKQSFTYRTPVNPTSIRKFASEQESGESDGTELQVYVTYAVKITNDASTLKTRVNSIINCFDNRYTLESAKINTTAISTSNIKNYSNQSVESIYKQPAEDYTEIKINNLNLMLEAGQTSKTIYLKYKISPEAVIELLNEEATLSNSVEIESYTPMYGKNTLHAQQAKYNSTTNKNYAGYDIDSAPGNAAIKKDLVDYTYTYTDEKGNVETKTFEDVKVLKSTENLVEYKVMKSDGTIMTIQKPQDDTDIAPSFLLCKGLPKTTILKGVVFEDTDVIIDDEERLGDGKYDATKEKTVQNVKIELYEIIRDDNGNVTIQEGQHYKDETASELSSAVVYSKPDGSYAFEVEARGKEYFMKFTYGDDTNELTNGATTIDGTTTINARNYKSTIIASDNPIRTIFDKDYEALSAEDKAWVTKLIGKEGYSIAVDNMLDRLEIDELSYENFHKNEDGTIYVEPENMTAYSKPFLIPEDFDYEEAPVFNFGIIERPRENLNVDKTITNLNIKLSNGQPLTGGNPSDPTQKIPYVKTLTGGGRQRVIVEMDTELIQGSYLEATYEVTVRNDNEIDYDYGNEGNYTDIVKGAQAVGQYDKFITKNEKAKYYYYGDKNGLGEDDIMKATLTLIDYMNKQVTVKGNGWEPRTIDEIEGFISNETKNTLGAEQYKILNITGNPEMKIEIARGEEHEFTTSMSISKTLANNADNTFDNNVEILTIDGKTARTIKEADDGEQIEKEYMPGNLVPAEGGEEQDDGIAEIVATPPTGIVTYIMYTIAGLIGLIAIVFGITFIKKKVLIK